jgi:hypothetical protein
MSFLFVFIIGCKDTKKAPYKQSLYAKKHKKQRQEKTPENDEGRCHF